MFNIGDKVNYGGGCWRVRRIKDGKALITGRSNWDRAEIPVEKLTAWVSPPKISEHARTCQICGRPIFAGRGMIAHHGYERPGHGYQTASCFGALKLPFEVDRGALGEWIEIIKEYIQNAKARAALLETRPKISVKVDKRDAAGRACYDHKGRRITEWVDMNPGDADYDRRLGIEQAQTESRLRHLELDLRDQTKRFNDWKPKT